MDSHAALLSDGVPTDAITKKVKYEIRLQDVDSILSPMNPNSHVTRNDHDTPRGRRDSAGDMNSHDIAAAYGILSSENFEQGSSRVASGGRQHFGVGDANNDVAAVDALCQAAKSCLMHAKSAAEDVNAEDDSASMDVALLKLAQADNRDKCMRGSRSDEEMMNGSRRAHANGGRNDAQGEPESAADVGVMLLELARAEEELTAAIMAGGDAAKQTLSNLLNSVVRALF
jgi:hypothetical protein